MAHVASWYALFTYKTQCRKCNIVLLCPYGKIIDVTLINIKHQ